MNNQPAVIVARIDDVEKKESKVAQQSKTKTTTNRIPIKVIGNINDKSIKMNSQNNQKKKRKRVAQHLEKEILPPPKKLRSSECICKLRIEVLEQRVEQQETKIR